MLNADVCSDFPLSAMLDAHRRQRHPFLLLGTTVRGLGGLKAVETEATLGLGVGMGVRREMCYSSSYRGVIGNPGPFGCWEVGGGMAAVSSQLC